jgi:hypothetical protein
VEALTRYIGDCDLPISNHWAKSRIRPVAPGQPHRRTATAPLVDRFLKNSGLPASSVKMTWPGEYA